MDTRVPSTYPTPKPDEEEKAFRVLLSKNGVCKDAITMISSRMDQAAAVDKLLDLAKQNERELLLANFADPTCLGVNG